MPENKKEIASECEIQFGADTTTRQHVKLRGEMARIFQAMGRK